MSGWREGLAATGDVRTLEVNRRVGKQHYTYRFAEQVPLRDG